MIGAAISIAFTIVCLCMSIKLVRKALGSTGKNAMKLGDKIKRLFK